MNIIETYGKTVQEWAGPDPDKARRLLLLGWQAQSARLRFFPNRGLIPADRYLARIMMDAMRMPLEDPQHSAMVSIFTPCEMLQELGLHPYNVEGFSSYLAGSKAERAFLQEAEDSGLSETLCSYHKTFIGAALSGVLPAPRCVVYTNLACDANLLSFRHLAQYYDVPAFAIDVPAQQTADAVDYVAGQLRDLRGFLEEVAGATIDEASLKARLDRSRRSQIQFDAFQTARADRYIPEDLVSTMYCGMTNNILLGTEEEARFVQMLGRDVKKAPPARGKRLYWMHTIPFWSQAARQALYLNEEAQIVGCELSQATDITKHDPDPYRDMAMRMVYHSLNGHIDRRIEAGIRHARQAGADGVVWFGHWGCKRTVACSGLARRAFEEAGLPCLILDGDGCDRSRGGEGQTATRLGAFLEMLEEDGHDRDLLCV